MITLLKERPGLVGIALVTIATIVASVFSYILQFFLGRYLTISDFGTFSALLSLIYILTLPATVFSTSLTKKVAALSSAGQIATLGELFKLCLKFALAIGVSLTVALLIFKPVIGAVFKINDFLLVAIFAFFVGVNYPAIVLPAFLQGALKYLPFSLFNVIGSLLRTLFPIFLVLIGWGLRGTFIGLTLSVILTFFVLLLGIREIVGFKSAPVNNGDSPLVSATQELRSVLQFSIPVAVVGLCLILINNIDVLVIKVFFDLELVGYYAGAVILGKIILFGAATTSIMMFPKISALKSANRNYKPVFMMFFGLHLTVILFAVGIFTLFPTVITHLFFGERFNTSIQYVPLYAIFIGMYSLVNFLSMFYLAIGKENIYKVLIGLVLVQAILLTFLHSSIYSVIFVNLGVATVGLLLMLRKQD